MSILNPLPERLLLGPGPSNAHPSVLEAMSLPLLGHLDPEFIALLDRVKEGLRTCFGTANAMTLPISATGSAGMEAALVNLLEPGETVVVGINGVFGVRMAEVVRPRRNVDRRLPARRRDCWSRPGRRRARRPRLCHVPRWPTGRA